MDEAYKKSISEIRQRKREKKLQHESAKNQAQNLSSTDQAPLSQSEISEDKHLSDSSPPSPVVRKIAYNQKIEQGIIQELILFIQKGRLLRQPTFLRLKRLMR